MVTTNSTLYALSYNDARTYRAAGFFVAGNLLFPQLFHFVPQGGVTWLPIYFFTLIGAYKYGWKVGLLTAILSPLLNAVLFGMPAFTALPAVVVKSILLAFAAGVTAPKFSKISIASLLVVVLSYQVAGGLFEWAMKGSFHAAVQGFRIGIPGMWLQVFGGYLFIKFLIRK